MVSQEHDMTQNGLPNLNVLIVDDNVDDVFIITRMLQNEFHLAWQRVDNEAGLLVALHDDKIKWDIILCDYKLPILEPERVLEVLSEERVPAPVIIISGSVDEEVAIGLLKKGARDFVTKDAKQGLPRLPLAIRRELRSVSEKFKDKKQVEEAYDATIEAWGKALELRDIQTRGHTVRVTTLALKLGRTFGISYEEFTNLNRGSLLHDIGKMGIPDAILLKRDVLSKEEMNIMKMHPVIGGDMLRGITFLKSAVDIPYCHHERWNGSGYPQGLKGEEIPFLARLFAVVDVYDALVTDRPYRKAWDKARVIDFLLQEKDITFDPRVIDSFVDMVGRG